MNINSTILIACVCGTVEVAVTATNVVSGRESTMTSFLSTNALVAFSDTIGQINWCAPVIHSQWYVDRLTNAEERAKEQLNREFGAVLVSKLADTAANVCSNQPYQVYKTNAIALMHLGKWIGTSEGYGNLLLGYRCFDIAYVCLARMVLDVSCPTGEIASLLPSYDLSWYNSRVVAAVLNQESGVRMFGLPFRWQKLCKPADSIQRVWDYGRHLSERIGKTTSANIEDIMAITPAESILARSHMEFFKDTSKDVPEPLTTIWNKKCHETLINRIQYEGTDMQTKIDRLRAVLRFRTTVGEFPTNVVLSGSEVSRMMRTYDLFEATWNKHYSVSLEHLSTEQLNRDLATHNSAADMYMDFVRGRLVDDDTKIMSNIGPVQ